MIAGTENNLAFGEELITGKLNADTPLERDTDRYFSILEKNGCYQSGQIGISRAWDICP